MKTVFTTIAASAALALMLTALPASSVAAQEQRRDDNSQVQHPDHSKNKFYTLGNREGYQDYRKKTQRTTHNHAYRNNTDRAAHDYGYQQGLQGKRGYQSYAPDRH